MFPCDCRLIFVVAIELGDQPFFIFQHASSDGAVIFCSMTRFDEIKRLLFRRVIAILVDAFGLLSFGAKVVDQYLDGFASINDLR